MANALESRPETQRTEVSSFTVHVLDPRNDFFSFERLAEIGRKYYRQREEQGRLLTDLRRPLSAVVLLGDPTWHLIGYAYAECDILNENATVRECAVDPDIQETGAVERLITELEKDLLKRGISKMQGFFTTENRYADRVAKLYPERLLEDRQEGVDRFLRINLSSQPSNVIPFPVRAA